MRGAPVRDSFQTLREIIIWESRLLTVGHGVTVPFGYTVVTGVWLRSNRLIMIIYLMFCNHVTNIFLNGYKRLLRLS